jgi:hypothetical protein
VLSRGGKDTRHLPFSNAILSDQPTPALQSRVQIHLILKENPSRKSKSRLDGLSVERA